MPFCRCYTYACPGRCSRSCGQAAAAGADRNGYYYYPTLLRCFICISVNCWDLAVLLVLYGNAGLLFGLVCVVKCQSPLMSHWILLAADKWCKVSPLMVNNWPLPLFSLYKVLSDNMAFIFVLLICTIIIIHFDFDRVKRPLQYNLKFAPRNHELQSIRHESMLLWLCAVAVRAIRGPIFTRSSLSSRCGILFCQRMNLNFVGGALCFLFAIDCLFFCIWRSLTHFIVIWSVLLKPLQVTYLIAKAPELKQLIYCFCSCWEWLVTVKCTHNLIIEIVWLLIEKFHFIVNLFYV